MAVTRARSSLICWVMGGGAASPPKPSAAAQRRRHRRRRAKQTRTSSPRCCRPWCLRCWYSSLCFFFSSLAAFRAALRPPGFRPRERGRTPRRPPTPEPEASPAPGDDPLSCLARLAGSSGPLLKRPRLWEPRCTGRRPGGIFLFGAEIKSIWCCACLLLALVVSNDYSKRKLEQRSTTYTRMPWAAARKHHRAAIAPAAVAAPPRDCAWSYEVRTSSNLCEDNKTSRIDRLCA